MYTHRLKYQIIQSFLCAFQPILLQYLILNHNVPFGPNGKKNKEYLPYYNQITEALKTLRENGIWDSRTILQESLFLREYAKNLNVKTQKYEMIVQAQELICSEINRLVEKKQDNFPHMGRR